MITLGGSSLGRAQVALPEQIDLPRLVDLCAQRLGARITYDDAALKGRVTIRRGAGLSDVELWRLTNRVLSEQGFTTVRPGDDDTLAVVKLSAAPQSARIERLDAYRAEAVDAARSATRAGFHRVLIPLRRASSKDIVVALQLVLSKPGGAASESEQAGLLMVADLTPSLDAAVELIDRLDGAEGGAVVKSIPAKNVDAARLATIAKQLADKRKAVGGREVRGELIAAPGGAGLVLIAPPAFIPDWEAILAGADQREAVEPRTYATGTFGTREVAALLEQTVRGASSGEDRWRVVFDDLTGTMIVTATPAQHGQIEELLKRLASNRRPRNVCRRNDSPESMGTPRRSATPRASSPLGLACRGTVPPSPRKSARRSPAWDCPPRPLPRSWPSPMRQVHNLRRCGHATPLWYSRA